MSKKECGLSIIESAIVLALSGSIIGGSLYYYRNTKENMELNDSIQQIQSIAATLNKLYAGQTDSNIDNPSAIIWAVSTVSGIPIDTSSGYPRFKTSAGVYIDLFWGKQKESREYMLSVQTKNIDSCSVYASLNMGTLMKKKTKVFTGTPSDNNEPGGALAPAEANKECMKAEQNGDPVKIQYTLGY